MRERGQSVVELLAVLAGVTALATAAAAAAPPLATAVAGNAKAIICAVGGGSCAAPAQAAQAPPTQPAPAPAAQPTPPALPAEPERDLCGSSWFNVPELWFTPACANHDRCYGEHRGKAACDTAFLDDMLEICKTVGSSSGGVNPAIEHATCRAAARLYYKGVVVGGGPSYCHRATCRKDE
jgi:hypothetical protein